VGDSRHTDGAGLAIGLAVVLIMILVLAAGAGVVFMWRRQQASVEWELARAQVAQAEAEQRLAEVTRAAIRAPDSQQGDHPKSIEAAIREVLQTQQRAWNAGDIDRFMESYWKSDDLTFSSGGKMTRSWQSTLENYKKKYPSRSDMGELSFRNLEVTPLGSQAAFVLGEWQLDRESADLGGNFTLVFRRVGEKWVIVHDHTSRTEEPE
jgi:ketosteroid isomerase-like protein